MSETLEFKYQEAKDFPASAYVCSLEDWLKLHNKIQNVIKSLKELPRLVLEDERNNPAWSETDLLEALKKCAAVIGEPQEGHWATLRAEDMATINDLRKQLQDAVKRMEEVSIHKLEDLFLEHATDWTQGLEAVRARLIQAAKGDQP